ncbi:MAG: hypothetical protein ACUVTH_02500 [Thermogutta sp.]
MSEEPRSSKFDKGHWEKLAELLGIASAAETADISESMETVESADTGEHPNAIGTGELGAQSVPADGGLSARDQAKAEVAASVPESIPLRSNWAPRPVAAASWDEIARQLGLAPSSSSASPVSDWLEGAAQSVMPEAQQERTPQSSAAEPMLPSAGSDASLILSPVEQTIEPPQLEEATFVTVATPEEPADIVQEEVSPTGDWLEEQVVAPVETPKGTSEAWPLTQDIVDLKDAKHAVAADTLLLPEVTPPMASGDGERLAMDSRMAEKKSRKRHRRKKKLRGTAPVNPEPFEEELPEIVELATGEKDEETLVVSQSLDEGVKKRQQEGPLALEKEHKKDNSTAGEATENEAEDATQMGEDSDLMRPAHKAIPGWPEVVGYVIQKNMAARARRPNHRDRRR